MMNTRSTIRWRSDVPNEDKWKELQEIKIVRKTPLEKKLNNITKVIQNPDQFNVNIASRERVDELEQRIIRLEEMLNGHDTDCVLKVSTEMEQVAATDDLCSHSCLVAATCSICTGNVPQKEGTGPGNAEVLRKARDFMTK